MRIIVTIGLVVLFGCSDLKVTSDYDKEVNFDDYDSFLILPWIQGDTLINRFDKARVVNAVKTQMMNHGHAYDETTPKLVVSLFLKLDNRTTTTAYTGHYGGYGYGYGYPGWGWGGGMSSTTYSDYHYTVGALVIDVYDAKTKNLVWQGVGAGTVDDNPQSREQRVPRNISSIFKKYPKAIQKY